MRCVSLRSRGPSIRPELAANMRARYLSVNRDLLRRGVFLLPIYIYTWARYFLITEYFQGNKGAVPRGSKISRRTSIKTLGRVTELILDTFVPPIKFTKYPFAL